MKSHTFKFGRRTKKSERFSENFTAFFCRFSIHSHSFQLHFYFPAESSLCQMRFMICRNWFGYCEKSPSELNIFFAHILKGFVGLSSSLEVSLATRCRLSEMTYGLPEMAYRLSKMAWRYFHPPSPLCEDSCFSLPYLLPPSCSPASISSIS